MNKKLIINGALGLLLAGSMASCSSDYLDTPPISSVTDYQVGENTENLAKAINGIGYLINYPSVANGTVDGGGYPCGTTGEAYMMTFFGDCFSSDTYQRHFAIFQGGDMMRMRYFSNATYYTSAKSWGFYYTIIRQANAILEKVESAEETGGVKREMIKAEALCYRAHAYVRLLQLFGPRWADSLNGERKCIVLRTQTGTESLPLVSMNEVLNQIYTDLDDAIALFSTSDDHFDSARANWATPTYDVACGLYARAALLKEDWAKAEEMAAKAQVGHTYMTNAQWCNGFMEANDDYLWTNSVSAPNDVLTNISWGAYNACNGNYPTYWQYGCGNINIDLVRQLDPNDIRLTRFVIPQNINQKEEYWWDSKYCGATTMSVYQPTRRNWVRAILNFVNDATPTQSQGEEVITGYTDIAGRGISPTIIFGAQLKFYVYGGSNQLSQYPYMRATEMLLTQAEAAYQQGKIAEAQSLISKLTTMRIPGSAPVTKTGQALLDEIRLQRRIELWGEGTTFFDMKRWSMNNTRRAWVEGDVNSGSVCAVDAMDITPDQANHWVLRVPAVETDYNLAIDQSELVW